MRRPAAPLPLAPAARLPVLTAFATLGALHWARLLENPDMQATLLPVGVAVLGALGLLLSERAPGPVRTGVVLFVAPVVLALAALASGIEWRLLRPGGWDELGPGMASGLEAVSGVRLPYGGADQWPRLVIQLGGGLLIALSALLAMWPRGGEDPEEAHGYPFLSLSGLVALVIVPAVSLGNQRPFVVGMVLAALVVLFLFLDRIIRRPGLSIAALLMVAVIGALPLASAADRDEPWFDYQTFAETVGPDDPVRIDFGHSDYGPISLPRDGRELLRVRSEKPLYWKAVVLDGFDGERWITLGDQSGDPRVDLPNGWENQPSWTQSIRVTIKRLRTRSIVSAGTTVDYFNATRSAVPGVNPGIWETERDLRRGDSYEAQIYSPQPSRTQLESAATDPNFAKDEYRTINVPLVTQDRTGAVPRSARALPASPDDRLPNRAIVDFPAFESVTATPTANYPETGDAGLPGDVALTASPYRRTWRLAQELKSQAATPYGYVELVDAYLKSGFTYSERPAPVPEGRAPLDGFLFDTRSGYCQHYSAAMALLLRMGGVPARVVTGFSPGGYSKRREEWIVRDTDAHSWVEAWFDRYGWVTLDPTPSGTPARSQIAAIDPAPSQPVDDRTGDAGGLQGTDRGTGDSAGRSGVRGDLLLDQSGLESSGGSESVTGEEASGWMLPVRAWVAGGVLLLAAIAGGVLLVRRRRRAEPGTPEDRALAELVRALSRTGRDVPAGTTLRDLERRLGGSAEAAAYLRALRAARYTPTPRLPSVAERRALRRELAAGLGLTGRVRALWALPPRRG